MAGETAPDQPRFSVVVPAHNSAPYITSTLESLHAQTRADWEAVVVDDGSQDDTAARAGAFGDARVRVYRQTNQGPSVARNAGLARARGAYIVFLDSDDGLLPDALERFAAALEDAPDAVAAYGEARIVDADGRPLSDGGRPVFHGRPSGDVLGALVRQNFVVTPGVLCMRRAAAAEAGGFRPELHVSEDWEFWCRLALRGHFLYLDGAPVLSYRRNPGGVVRTRGLQPDDALACVHAIFENGEIAARLGGRIARLRRQAEAGVYGFTANQHLRDGRWAAARRLLFEAVRRDPLRLREWVLLGCALARFLPRRVAELLK